MPLTAEVLTYPVETLSPFFETILSARPVAVRLLYLDACVLHRGQRSSGWRTGSSTPRLPVRSPGRHDRALLCSPLLQDIGWNDALLISMSLVAMARATSTTAMPTSRGVKSSFGGLPPIAILPNRAYPAARPETTALWYSALTDVYPGLWARGLPPPTWNRRASACLSKYTQVNSPLDKPL